MASTVYETESCGVDKTRNMEHPGTSNNIIIMKICKLNVHKLN